MRALLLIALCSVASADTIHFDEGETDRAAAHRCGNNISNWTSRSALTLSGSASTLLLDGKSFEVDRMATTSGSGGDYTDYMFDTAPTHTVSIRVGGFDCADINCKTLNVTYVVQKHPDAPASTWNDDNTCHETWRGKAHHGDR